VSPDISLSRQIHSWRRLAPPVDRFRSGQRGAPTFELELMIDHIKTGVDSLLDGWLAGHAWDYTFLANSEIEAINQAAVVLHSAPLSTSEGEHYRRYLDVTASLVERIAQSSHPQPDDFEK
jgi:hypothetical protein